ncbi:DUF2066 domain-containing protein [Aliiglaciecola litoralis]|uniref:DUF2066 domain-containing protein n=1 Tax=Aliiglaciecola litoralis TaxID=582857 RepID=A0ABN1LCL4_9ALTE
MRLTVYLFLFLPSLFLCGKANAAIVDGLYQASVKIEGQTFNHQKKAAKQALSQVLVKISGNRQLLEDKAIKDVLNRAEDLLLSYQFERSDTDLFYNAYFDVNKVEEVIRSTQYPLWGKHRPQTLIWFAIEDQVSRKRTLVSDTTAAEIVQKARKTAFTRGISIHFPILDLTDIQQVSVYDVWSSYSQNLLAASERYATEYMMSARMYYRSEAMADRQQAQLIEGASPVIGNVWVIEWMLTRQGVFDSGEITALLKDTAIDNLIETLADTLASKYAIRALQGDNSENTTQIQIANISSLTAYADVMRFLKSLSMVVDVTLIEQQGDLSTFELHLFGARENLEHAFSLENRLQRPSDNFGQPMLQAPLRWKP